MDVSGHKEAYEHIWTSVLYFLHITPNLFQALVITYDHTSQALAVEADAMLQMPFQELGHHLQL
jgi:hypothetical protein